MFREGKDNPPKNDGGKEVKSPESREAKKLEDKVSSLESVYKKANDAPSPREEKQKLYTNEYAKQVDEAKASVGQALRNIEKKKNNLNEKDPKYLQKLGKLNKQEAQYKSAEARLTKIQKDVNPALAERNNEKAVAKVSKICQDVDSGKKKCYTHEDRQQAKKAEKDIQNTYQNINSERKSLQKSDPDYASKMKDLDARAQTCENQLQKVQAASEKMRDAEIQEKTAKNKEASDKVKEKGGNELRHYPEGTEDKLKDTMDNIQESMDYLKQEKSRLEKTEPKDTQKLKELDKQLDKRQEQLEDTKGQLEDYRNAYINDVLKDCEKYDKKIDNAWNPDAKQERLYSEKTEQRIETAENKAQESLDQLKQEQAALQKERAALVEKAEKSDPKPEQADSKEPAKTENPDAKDPSKTEQREGADTEDIKKKLSPEDAAKLDALDKQLEKVDKAIGDRQDQLDKLQDHADKAREAQIDKHYDDLIKVRDKGNQVGESEAKGEKQKLYTADVAKDVNAAVDRLEAYVDHLKEKQAALDQKEPDKNEPVDQRVEEKRKLDHEIKKREGQLAELRPLAQEVADIREDKRLSENQKPFEAIYDQFNKTPPPSPEQKRELYSHDFIDAAQAQRDAVAQRYEQVDSRMKDLEKNNQSDTPEYYRLKGERFERGRDLASMDIILKDAKNFEYNAALEMGEERYCAEMGKSKLEQKWELKKDQECVRNHRVVSHRLEQERAKAVEARNGVEGELLVMRNQYGQDELNKMPEYKDLCDRHNKLDDVIGTYDAQIRHLDQQCDRLQDKHGKDEYGEYILSIKSTELQLPDGKADQAVADLVDRVNVDHAGKGLTAGECAKTLNVLEDVNRNVIPALTQEITGLKSQLEGAKAYCAENPQDSMMASYPAQLEKELAKKTQQLSCLTEGASMLQTEMHTSDLHHSAALHYHSDGTWSVVQNWTNAEDKLHSAKNFESKSRLYANTYQRTSTVRFDENGDAIAKSFGFQYKAVGVYSECQLGGKNLNIQNVFDGSLLNASASVGYNKEAHGMGVFANASASVAEISNQASLNMLNKQVFQVSAEASLAKASAKAGLEGGLPAVSFSANAGLEASVEASVGKLKVFTAEYSALTHEVKGSLNIPDLIDGKTAENVLQVNHEPGSKTSHAFGDVITIFQQENANGQITSRTFLNDFKDLFETAGGRAQLAEQMGKIADIQENGILDDVNSDDKITVMHSRKPSEQTSPAEPVSVATVAEKTASNPDADNGHRTLNSVEAIGAATIVGAAVREGIVSARTENYENTKSKLSQIIHDVQQQRQQAAIEGIHLSNDSEKIDSFDMDMGVLVQESQSHMPWQKYQDLKAAKKTEQPMLQEVMKQVYAEYTGTSRPDVATTASEMLALRQEAVKLLQAENAELQAWGVESDYLKNVDTQESVRAYKDLSNLSDPDMAERIYQALAEGNEPDICYPSGKGLDLNKPIQTLDGSTWPAEDYTLYRQGGPWGTNITATDTGVRPDNNDLSLPYMKNPDSMHQYVMAQPEMYKELIDCLTDGSMTPKEKAQAINQMIAKYNTGGKEIPDFAYEDQLTGKQTTVADETVSAWMGQIDHFVNSIKGEHANKVKLESEGKPQEKSLQEALEENHIPEDQWKYGFIGRVAPMKDNRGKHLYDGGATQINPAVHVDVLLRLGIIREKR